MPTYKRFEHFVGKGDPVEITEDEFENAKKAKACLFPALFIEEQFDLILKSYAEFEVTLFRIGMKSVLHFPADWSGNVDDILLVNSRVIDFFTNCRMYVDHVPQRLQKIYGKDHQSIQDFRNATSAEYDKYLGYRFCYELRNYTQHGDLPVDGLFINSIWSGDRTKCERRIAVHTTIADLKNSKFKKEVLKDLKADNKGRIDTKPLIRQNMACLGRVNKVVREQLEPDIDLWEQWIKTVVGKSHYGTQPVLGHFDDAGNLVEEVRVSNDWAERLRTLLYKNFVTTHYDLHYVNGDVIPPQED